MEKTIMIGDKSIRLKAGASFARIFKGQFGYDILTVIMPLIAETLQNIDIALTDLDNQGLEVITLSQIGDVLEGVYSLELVDIQNIIWAMAKVADNTIPEPEKWEEQFEEYPVFDIGVEAIKILIPSLVSKKKWEQLTKTAQ